MRPTREIYVHQAIIITSYPVPIFFIPSSVIPKPIYFQIPTVVFYTLW